MADLRRFGLLDVLLLLAVLAVAGGARAGYLLTCADGSRNPGPLRVQDRPPPLPDFTAPPEMPGAPHPSDQEALIYNLQQHHWFGSLAPFAPHEEQTAHVSPGYPWLLALLARTVPADRLPSTARWIQAALGALTCGLWFLFARRAFRSLCVGLLAGLLTAVYPFWIIDVAALDDGVLASFLLAGAVFLGARAGETGGAAGSLLYGLTLAGTALVRAALLPFAFVSVVWFLLRTRSLPRGWLAALLAFLGFANGLAPWTVRNIQVFAEPVPVVSSVWLHLWVGNNLHATGGPATEEMWSAAPADELRGVTKQTDRYNRLAPLVVQEVARDPARTVQRRLWAALAFVFGERWLREGTLAEPTPLAEAMPAWLADSYPLALPSTVLAMLLLAFLGWRWSYGWRWEAMPATLALLWVPLPYILGHAEALSGPRLPLDGVLLTLAAFALGSLNPVLRDHLLRAPGAGVPPVPGGAAEA